MEFAFIAILAIIQRWRGGKDLVSNVVLESLDYASYSLHAKSYVWQRSDFFCAHSLPEV
jgi:hypothetical protein